MDIRLIGVIKDSNSKHLGCRLLELESKSIQDVPIDSIIKAITSKKVSINGLEVRNGSLVGSNGNLDRYTTIINGNPYGKPALVVLSQYINDGTIVGYRVSDWKGAIANSSVDDTIKYSKQNGIANGAIKTINNKEFISSISGEYDKIITKSKQDVQNELENSVWTIKDFMRYMAENNYAYRIENVQSSDTLLTNEIYFKDPSMKIIKYPLGISEINRHFNTRPTDCELLILSPSINEVDFNILHYATELKRIVLQRGMEKFTGRGLNAVNANTKIAEIKFPYTLQEISNTFSGLHKITEINLYKTALKNIRRSFNDLQGMTYLSLPDELVTINSSFQGAKSLTHVSFPENLIEIYCSFNETALEIVDLSNCKNLKTVGYNSFRNCKQLKEVILPEGLEEIGYDSFTGCPNLEFVTFPSTLRFIGGNAFSGSKIKEFVVEKSLTTLSSGAFNEDTKICFDKEILNLPSNIVGRPGFKCVELPEGLKTIGRNAFSENSTLEQINMPNSLEIVDVNAFRLCSNLYNMDLRNNQRLKILDENAFESCEQLIEMILPEGLTSIGAYCFKDCTNIAYIVIPKSVDKIGRGAFENVGKKTDLGTTFYVYEKSMGIKYCKRNNLKHIIIKCIEDVYKYTNNDREITQSKAIKMKMILASNPLHKELLTKEYINFADILHRVYNHLNSEQIKTESKISLDTTKFIDFPVSKVPIIYEYIQTYYKANKTEEYVEEFSVTNLSPRLVVLCNYITKIMEFNHTPFTVNGMKYLNDSASVQPLMIYNDKCSQIIALDVGHYQYTSTMFKSLVVVIVIDNKIKFVGCLDKNRNTKYSDVLSTIYNYSQEIKAPVSELLSVNDEIQLNYYYGSSYNKIGGAPLPKYIYNLVANSIKNNLIVVGHEEINDSKNIDEKTSIIVDYMCLDTGKIITTQSKISTKTSNIEIDLSEIGSMLITDIKDFYNMSKETEKRMIYGITSEKTKRLFAYKSKGEEYTKELTNQPGAYNTDSSYEWEVAQLLDKAKVQSIGDLQISIFKLIVDTAFFIKIRKTHGDVKRSATAKKAIRLEESNYVLVEYKLNKSSNSKKLPNGTGNYVVGLINTQDNIDVTQEFYTSNQSFEDIFEILLKLKESGYYPNKIENRSMEKNEYDSNFVTIQKQLETGFFNRFEYGSELAISRSTGGVYLIGIAYENKSSYYSILRFKSLELGIEYCRYMTEDSWKVNPKKVNEKTETFKKYIIQITNYLHTSSNYNISESNYVYKIREAVINGTPNNHHIECINIDLFDAVAKQPK